MEHLYEYAIIRIVPRVELEEFVNAGIILFCKKSGFLECNLSVNEKKVLCLDPKADMELINRNLEAFRDIAKGKHCGSAIAELPPPERFRWLTATRSTIIQCNKVHPGYTSNEQEALDRLMRQFFSPDN